MDRGDWVEGHSHPRTARRHPKKRGASVRLLQLLTNPEYYTFGRREKDVREAISPDLDACQ